MGEVNDVNLSQAVVRSSADDHEDADAAAAFALPLVLMNADGLTRQVGVEVEFMGLSARAAAHALAAELDGAVIEEDPHAYHVQHTRIGDLTVELDLRHVHPRRPGPGPLVRLGVTGAAWLGSVLGGVVPRELITPPMPIGRLAVVDRAVDVLRRAGARGRGETLFGSLGLHFNIDPPGLDAETLTSVLKAFLLLNPWLRREAMGDGTRRSYLQAVYPEEYVHAVVAPSYWPDLQTLAEDYLAANPTRDRDLDLLPLLLHFDEARVRAQLPNEKIGNRAVFHYRLPRAHVSRAGWSLAPEWNRWVDVECLALDRDRLDALGRAYLDAQYR